MSTLPPPPLDLLASWLSIDSTTGQEAAYLEALEQTFRAAGLNVTRQPVAEGRWNIMASEAERPRIIFNTHVDTVPPFFGPRWDGPLLRARGACDTKGGLYTMWAAWCGLEPAERAEVGFSLVVGEEVDHIGAIEAAKEDWSGVDAIIMCEPTQNRLSRGQKGILKLVLEAEGKAGHSAFLESGFSANHALIAVCNDLLEHTWPVDEGLGETTLNIGVMGGGVAANVFAPSARAELLFRVVSDLDALRAEVAGVIGGRVRAVEVAANDAIPLLWWEGFETDVVPFNTDAPYLCHHAPVVLVGPGDIRTAHCADEHIHRDAIDEGVALYQRLVRGLLSGELRTDGSKA